MVLGALKHAGVDALKGGVVTFRNNINKIFGTVIDPKKEWTVGACMLSEYPTLFLNIEVCAGPSSRSFCPVLENMNSSIKEIFIPSLMLQDHGREKMYPDAERFTYYGYKFETICTGGGEGLVDATSESVLVSRSRLNEMDLIIASEVDSCDAEELPGKDGTPDISTFVELKTSRFGFTLL